MKGEFIGLSAILGTALIFYGGYSMRWELMLSGAVVVLLCMICVLDKFD